MANIKSIITKTEKGRSKCLTENSTLANWATIAVHKEPNSYIVKNLLSINK